MRDKLLLLGLVIFLPACTQYQTYTQSTGFMAPEEHQVLDPLVFCTLNLSISDPRYSEKDRQLVEPLLKAQVTKYINADGRLKVSQKNCQRNSVTIDFSDMTDTWDGEKEMDAYSVKANTQFQYGDLYQTFSLEETSGKAQFYGKTTLVYASSVRNRTRFMDKWISKVDAMIREGI